MAIYPVQINNTQYSITTDKRDVLSVDNDNIDFQMQNDKSEICTDEYDFENAEFGFFEKLFSSVSNIFHSRNGKIQGACQGKIDDCYYIAGIDSLSYTKEGKKIIKNAIEYRPDGAVVRTIAGDYFISNERYQEIVSTNKHATGDDDMIMLEEAGRRIMEDIKEGNIVVAPDSPSYLKDYAILQSSINQKHLLSNGENILPIYLLTGKPSKIYKSDSEQYKSEVTELFNNIEKNKGKDLAASFSLPKGSKITVLDKNGKPRDLYGHHSYAIKKVKNGVVTIINPWDPKEELQFSYDALLNFDATFYSTDLSDENKAQNYFVKGYKETISEEKGSSEYIYEENGHLAYITNFDEENRKTSLTKIRGDNQIMFEASYYETGEIEYLTIYRYSENNEALYKTVEHHDKEGNLLDEETLEL